MHIGFIGAGQMAQALASGFVRGGHVAGSDVRAADCSSQACQRFQLQVPGVQIVGSNRQLIEQSDTVFLAVKPQQMSGLFRELHPVAPDRLLVSVAAGVTLAQLGQGLGTQRVIRVMPNTPCLIGQGAAGYCLGSQATEEDAVAVGRLLDAVGISCRLSESLLDAVTGLSGSGPAFVYQFIEALSDAGVWMGLPRDIATRLAAQTVVGAAQMVQQTGEHPAVLRDRVTSPGGTTIAGLEALERGALRATVMSAVRAATERSRELGQSPPDRRGGG